MESKPKAEWIPAHINYDGPAKVNQYFNSRVKPTGNDNFVGFFRGHELIGRNLSLPEGYEASLVSIEGDKITKVSDIGNVRVWDNDIASLDFSMQFTDVISISNILAED